jgi:hypothetical protein
MSWKHAPSEQHQTFEQNQTEQHHFTQQDGTYLVSSTFHPLLRTLLAFNPSALQHPWSILLFAFPPHNTSSTQRIGRKFIS